MTDSADRLLAISRRWPRHQWDYQGQSRWKGWGWLQYLYAVIFGLLINSIALDITLWSGGQQEPWWPFGLLAESSAGLSVVALLIVVNGWLIDRGLADRTDTESRLPSWLRWLRRTLASIPVAGLYIIPLWRWFLQAHPAWVSSISTQPRLDLSVRSSAAPSLLKARIDSLRRAGSQSLLVLSVWMIGGQIAPWLALLSWLTTYDSLTSGRRLALLGLSIVSHVLAFACGIQYAALRNWQIRASRWRTFALRYVPLVFLLPAPFCILGLILWVAALDESGDKKTLASQSYSRRGLTTALAAEKAMALEGEKKRGSAE